MRLCLATVDFFLVEALTETLGLGVVEGFVIGDLRKADGEGIVIVAIGLMKQSEASKSGCCRCIYYEEGHAKGMINILCAFFLFWGSCACVRCAPWGVGVGEEGRVVGLGAEV